MAETNVKADSQAVEIIADEKMSGQEHVIKTFQAQSIFSSVKEAPFAVATCLYMLFTCIMWGYDGMAAAIVLSIPRWRQDYGYLWEGQYVVAAKWQLAFTAGSVLGLVVGGLATGWVAKRIGQKKCLYFGHFLTIGGVFAQWYSPGDLPLFMGGKILTGIPLGIFYTVAPAYCSDVAPEALRGSMVGAINFCLVIGQLLGYAVMRETQAIDGQNSYRIMYAVQWGFAGVGLGFLPFIPESPFRLLARRKTEDAKKSIARLYGSHVVESKFDEIQDILAKEEEAAKQAGSYKDCFNAANRKRTLIALSIYLTTNMSGTAWVVGYMGYFLQLGGMEGQKVFDITVAIAGVMAVGCICSWPLIEKLGRRGTFLVGMFTLSACLFLIGILTQFIDRSNSILLAQVSFMAIWAFTYQATIGSAQFPLMAEIPTSSLRAITISMGTACNGVGIAVWSFALPYMINPDEGNMGGNIAFIFFGLTFLLSIFAFFYYPETKGRSFEEIDELFARKVNLRHWAGYKL